MPVLPNMGLITPTLGGDSGVWDDRINAAFALVDAHDHTSGKGVTVPVAGLNINADLPMGAFGLTALGKISFTAITAPVTGSKNLFVNTADNELYWRTNAGTNVKLTNGASINTTLVGGIVGDYSTVGAEVAFDDANKRYTFKDESSPTKKWARLASGQVRLYEYNTTVTNYVEQASPAALATSYTVTWPAAVPGATSLVQMSAAGVLTASNTLTNAITAPDFKTTASQTLTLPGAMWVEETSGTHTKKLATSSGGQIGFVIAASTVGLNMPIPLKVGDTITGFILYCKKTSSGSGNMSADLISVGTSSTVTGVEHTFVNTTANNPGFITISASSLAFTVAAGTQYYLRYQSTGTQTGDEIYQVEIAVIRT